MFPCQGQLNLDFFFFWTICDSEATAFSLASAFGFCKQTLDKLGTEEGGNPSGKCGPCFALFSFWITNNI